VSSGGAKEAHLPSAGYQFFMLVLCIFALAGLLIRTAVRFEPATAEILDYADHAVCALFFLDFLYSLVRAPNRWRYLATWGWLDLLSSIPMISAARWGRAARVVRIVRIFRGLRATRILAGAILRRRAESAFLAAALVALLLIVFCSIAILNFETAQDSNIKTAEDAIWWAFATVTTVGYGDRFPVTPEGRFVATILMCSGVGLFGTFSGFLAAWFIGPTQSLESKISDELRVLQEEVAKLREVVTARSPGSRTDRPTDLSGAVDRADSS
jgi:voltage-gated potassium channel